MKVSVVIATFNRASLIDKALATHALQRLPRTQWEYLLADDGSQDNTREVAEKWKAAGLPIRYFDVAKDLGLPKQPGQWRDGCVVRNAASTHANGEVIVLSHPEIMVPDNALEVMYDTVKAHPQNTWVTAIPYWVPPADYPAPASMKDLLALRKLPGFYAPHDPVQNPGAPDYSAHNQERRSDWESEVFFAMYMSEWRRIGGFRHFEKWGSVDMDFLARRNALGLKTVIARDPQAKHRYRGTPDHAGTLMVWHRHHDEGKRDLAAAMAELEQAQARYPDAEAAIAAGGLTAVYRHGPRERAEQGIEGVMVDHLTRYRFIARYCSGADVLDIPCGTGYGAQILAPIARTYMGIDLDAESVEWGTRHYEFDNVTFAQGDMTAIPVPDASFDQIVCYEGIEHIADRVAFANEMHRVLRPGGHFVISTPQKDVAPGTPWDAHMMTWQELWELFAADQRWVQVDPFYQLNYGNAENPVHPGPPPADALVMLLGGTKAS